MPPFLSQVFVYPYVTDNLSVNLNSYFTLGVQVEEMEKIQKSMVQRNLLI